MEIYANPSELHFSRLELCLNFHWFAKVNAREIFGVKCLRRFGAPKFAASGRSEFAIDRASISISLDFCKDLYGLWDHLSGDFFRRHRDKNMRCLEPHNFVIRRNSQHHIWRFWRGYVWALIISFLSLAQLGTGSLRSTVQHLLTFMQFLMLCLLFVVSFHVCEEEEKTGSRPLAASARSGPWEL